MYVSTKRHRTNITLFETRPAIELSTLNLYVVLCQRVLTIAMPSEGRRLTKIIMDWWTWNARKDVTTRRLHRHFRDVGFNLEAQRAW